MKQDRFLLGILIFILFLVAVALGLFFMRQGTQTYGPEGDPVGIVRNYALAIQNMEFERAYAYLAEKEAKPSYEAFRMVFLNHQLDPSNAAIQVGPSREISDTEAVVEVTIMYTASDPFSRPWSDNQNASLVKQAGVWKLTFMPNPYWGWDWYTPTPVPAKP